MCVCDRKNMVGFLLLLLGLTSVGGLSLYEAKEGDSVPLKWDSPTEMDLSLLNMNFFKAEPPKLVFEMVRGEEKPKNQDRQFSGRVHCDREALRQGQVRIYLTRLGLQDSGDYRCEMAANYVRDKGEWAFLTSEHFVINVTLLSGPAVMTSGGVQHEDDVNKHRDAPGLSGSYYNEERTRKIITVVCLIAFMVIVVVIKKVAIYIEKERIRQRALIYVPV